MAAMVSYTSWTYYKAISDKHFHSFEKYNVFFWFTMVMIALRFIFVVVASLRIIALEMLI